MRNLTQPLYENTGILTIEGREYRIDTYYPMGKARPEYRMFHVWGKTETHTFASEEGFFDWLDAKQQPTQQVLF